MENFCLTLVLIWPLVALGLARFFHLKQNGRKAWTGGPISWPKSMWLAYTVANWFFLPLWLLGLAGFPPELRPFFLFHLVSWWIRGPLELVMIYRWLNWTPKYGISHDLFHLLIGGILFFPAVFKLMAVSWTPVTLVATIFALVILLTTIAEMGFAALFFFARSQQEQDENIYFASDDPKWILINRVTASVVIPVYLHLLWQSFFLLASRS